MSIQAPFFYLIVQSHHCFSQQSFSVSLQENQIDPAHKMLAIVFTTKEIRQKGEDIEEIKMKSGVHLASASH